jgi:formylglycine-generating enzyme required for sulfatase activity
MEDLTGRQFGPYRVVASLGEGGMAAVYQAFQPSVDRYVALKVLSPEYTNDAQFLARFRREAKTVAQLQHPHILQVFEFGEVDGYTFLAMPYIQGGTLAALLKGNAVSLSVTARVIRQICAALDYAHAKGIVHRDMKPANILIDEGGNCLVADFGLAGIAAEESAAKLTLAGTLMGTPDYMSPEQAAGKPAGPESDIYSIGIILYEMLTGRVPFKGKTPREVANKHLTDVVPSPRSFNPAISADVQAVILKALARNRKDRFSSGKALATGLAAAMPSVPQIDTGFLTRDQAGAGVPSQVTHVLPDAPPTAQLSPPGASLAPMLAPTVVVPETSAAHVQTPDPVTSKRTPWVGIGVAVVLLLATSAAMLFKPGPADPAAVVATPSEPASAAATAATTTRAVAWATIPAGSFEMGCTRGDSECDDNESPRHNVRVGRPFELMTTELTVAMTRAAGRTVPGQPEWSRDDHPVVNINWDEAAALCRAMGGRLPTEAEWEYAARGGAVNARFPWGDDDPVATSSARNGARFNPSASTIAVASHGANGYGLYDMAGNVWEWVADWYGDYTTVTQSDPRGPQSGSSRVLRGGSWFNLPRSLRVSDRDFHTPTYSGGSDGVSYGVRCARDASR